MDLVVLAELTLDELVDRHRDLARAIDDLDLLREGRDGHGDALVEQLDRRAIDRRLGTDEFPLEEGLEGLAGVEDDADRIRHQRLEPLDLISLSGESSLRGLQLQDEFIVRTTLHGCPLFTSLLVEDWDLTSLQ